MFCSVCGSNVITTNETNDSVRGHVIVMAGGIDKEDVAQKTRPFAPQQEFYCSNKPDWYKVIPDTVKFDGMT
jgi:hypothetical protein